MFFSRWYGRKGQWGVYVALIPLIQKYNNELIIALQLVLNRLWVNATKGKNGYVLASISGNSVNFALSLNTTGSHTMATLVYLTNEV